MGTLGDLLKHVDSITVLPFAIVGFFGFGFVASLWFYNFNLSTILAKIGVEGLIIFSVVCSAFIQASLMILFMVLDLLVNAKLSGSGLFVSANIFGMGILCWFVQANYTFTNSINWCLLALSLSLLLFSFYLLYHLREK